MAWHKHRIKRLKQSKRKRTRNVAAKRTLKTLIKELLLLLKEKKLEDAKIRLKKITSTYAKTAKRGIVKRKTASRHISRLTKKVNKLAKG